MGGIKTSLIVIVLELLACLVVLGLRRDEPVVASVSHTAERQELLCRHVDDKATESRP